jgi:hypothetical protein
MFKRTTPYAWKSGTSKYDKKYAALVKDHLSNMGTINGFAASIGVHRDTIYDWINRKPDFARAVMMGEGMREEKTVQMLNGIAATGDGNATAAIFLAKNFSNLTDKTQVEHSGGIEYVSNIPDSGVVKSKTADTGEPRKRGRPRKQVDE